LLDFHVWTRDGQGDGRSGKLNAITRAGRRREDGAVASPNQESEGRNYFETTKAHATKRNSIQQRPKKVNAVFVADGIAIAFFLAKRFD
jgi:hypothetical protein